MLKTSLIISRDIFQKPSGPPPLSVKANKVLRRRLWATLGCRGRALYGLSLASYDAIGRE